MQPIVFHKLLSPEAAVEKVLRFLPGQTTETEEIPLDRALNRTLAIDYPAAVDSPPFDRSEVDGYAVDAKSTYGAEEDKPLNLKVIGEAEVGHTTNFEVQKAEAAYIATGAPIPRGANAVVMVEYTKKEQDDVLIYRSLVPGENFAQTGSDVMVGDVTLRSGTVISPREIAMLAALGYSRVEVYRRLKVAVYSTGDELVKPGEKLQPAKIFDANGPIILSMLQELGLDGEYLGILRDEYGAIKYELMSALQKYDVVLTSGSTSAGTGDFVYRILNDIGKPGIVVHGLKIKPGKPTVAAVVDDKLVVGLPGFPVSAMVAFSVFASPILRKLARMPSSFAMTTVPARMAIRMQAGKGKREYIPVNVVTSARGLVAYPQLAGSGSVSTLAMADGFVEAQENREYVEMDEPVQVSLFSSKLALSDLDIIGSHCPGIDILLELSRQTNAKIVNVGSIGGWHAVKRGEADIAGTHLLNDESLEYNITFLDSFELNKKALLIRGYSRTQGFVVPKGNPKGIKSFQDLSRDDVVIINRNIGSGTRAFIDHNLKLLDEDPAKPIRGYDHEAKTHSAVAAAVAQGRADVGVAVKVYALSYGLDFIPLDEEIFDFLIPKERLEKMSVQRFLETLRSPRLADELSGRLPGYASLPETGRVIAE